MPKPKLPRVCLFTGVSGRLGQDFVARHGERFVTIGVYNRHKPTVPISPLSAKEAKPGGIFGVQVDLGADGAVEEMVGTVLDRFGSVDLVVNAAVMRRFGPAAGSQVLDSLDWQLFINVTVPARIVGSLVAGSWNASSEDNHARRRNVVNLSSTAGQTVYPRSGQGGYSASKAALDMMTVHSAVELAAIGVRVNAIAPNTFPGIVSTASVSDAIRRFDKGKETGQILVIDSDGERLLPSRVWETR